MGNMENATAIIILCDPCLLSEGKLLTSPVGEDGKLDTGVLCQ